MTEPIPTIYRCTECGKLSRSLGGLHAHIEKHRPVWQFWKMGSAGFLVERTEVVIVDDCRRMPYKEFVADGPAESTTSDADSPATISGMLVRGAREIFS